MNIILKFKLIDFIYLKYFFIWELVRAVKTLISVIGK